MGSKKNIIKSLILTLLVFIIILGVGGCMKENKIEMAQDLLKEKYDADFTVYSYGKSFGTLTDNTFTVICARTDEPELRFEAEIAKDGSYMFDEYVSRKVSDKLEKKMYSVLKTSETEMAVKVGSATKTIDSNDADMSLEDFIELLPNAKFAIYVAIDKEELTQEEASGIVDIIKGSMLSAPNINGYIYIYLGPTEMVHSFNKYNRESPGADKGMFDILEQAKCVEAKISESTIDIDVDALMI